ILTPTGLIAANMVIPARDVDAIFLRAVGERVEAAIGDTAVVAEEHQRHPRVGEIGRIQQQSIVGAGPQEGCLHAAIGRQALRTDTGDGGERSHAAERVAQYTDLVRFELRSEWY